MKIRKKIITLSTAAACLAVLVAAAALGTGISIAPNPDVLTQPVLKEDTTHNNGNIPVFTLENDAYYHAESNCGGIENAQTMPESEAINLGKQPCPVCIPVSCPGHDGEEIEFVYYAQGEKYFHKTETCSGSTFALRENCFTLTETYPEKEPCPICFPDGILVCLHRRVFAAEEAQLLPETEEYNAPTVAPETSEQTAIHAPTTAPEEFNGSIPEVVSEEINPSLLPAAEESALVGSSTVYVEYGAYTGSYHKLQNCGGREFRREITESQAIHENFSPCPACICGEIYYTENGICYHSNDTCQGMMNAQACARKEARFDHKMPCQLCLNVYCTQNGTYFHVQEKCMGMQNAQLLAQSEAIAMGKQRCPICWSPAEVYATEKGNYFHADQYCSGMEGAQASNAEYEWNIGKYPCPVCIFPLDGNNGTQEENLLAMFYCTEKGNYYHSDMHCSGMENAIYGTLSYALALNKRPCPVCISTASPETASTKLLPENYDLFTTAFGQEIEDLFPGYSYDHSSNFAWVVSNGDDNYDIELCEVYPEGTAFFGEELPGLPELNLINLSCDPVQVHVFMKTVPEPIGSMYTYALAEVESHAQIVAPEELNLQNVKVYFDANRRVNKCEMQFGFYDHLKLAWNVNLNGQIELIQNEFVRPGWA